MLFSNPLTSLSLPVYTVYLTSILLHKFLPAIETVGYACDNATRKPLVYRLNGFRMLVVSMLIVYFIWKVNPKSILVFRDKFSGNAITGCAYGLALSSYFYMLGGKEKYVRCLTSDQIADGREPALAPAEPAIPSFGCELTRFFLGCLWNPRIWDVDVKMFLYAVGAIQLQVVQALSSFIHITIRISQIVSLYMHR
jgi:hypothetical protein